jgi:hypothetical protein
VLARSRPEIRRVLLFGSLATGRAAPGSDADLLVILDRSNRPFRDRIPQYVPNGCHIGVDVFPYTLAELEAMKTQGNWLITRALAEGVEVYDRERVGPAPRRSPEARGHHQRAGGFERRPKQR